MTMQIALVTGTARTLQLKEKVSVYLYTVKNKNIAFEIKKKNFLFLKAGKS